MLSCRILRLLSNSDSVLPVIITDHFAPPSVDTPLHYAFLSKRQVPRPPRITTKPYVHGLQCARPNGGLDLVDLDHIVVARDSDQRFAMDREV